jgi:serine/threonine protein phosphatase PrpC
VKVAIKETWDMCEAGFQKRIEGRYERNLKNFKPKKEGDKCKFPCDGSTATVAMLVGNKFYIVGCGDSAAVSVGKDKEIKVYTADHSTTVASEVAR